MTAGCGHLTDNLAQRELIVQFDVGATAEQHEQVRAACNGFAGTTLEPRPTSTLESVRLNDVRYRVDRADDAQLARIEACLSRFPFVRGVRDTGLPMH
jgi:hypothetical protein